MEIYNDKIFDLLHSYSDPSQCSKSDFVITEDIDGRGTFVKGLNEVIVTSEKEALNLLFGRELARTTATHKLNKRSNRSHSIFTIYIQKRQKSGASERVTHSKLHLVDLAGSERIKKTMDGDDRTLDNEVTRRESMQINQSLSYLEQCIMALSKRQPAHIPFRQSSLTHILKDCLGANCNTVMFACIWGEETHIEESLSTLRFATRLMRVENETNYIESIDTTTLLKNQDREIRLLKQELLMRDTLADRVKTRFIHERLSSDQQLAITHEVHSYLDTLSDVDEEMLDISSVRKMFEICRQLKEIVLSTRQELINLKQEAFMHNISSTYHENNDDNDKDSSIERKYTDDTNEDFMTKNSSFSHLYPTLSEFSPEKSISITGIDSSAQGGFALGIAPSNARPLNSRQQGNTSTANTTGNSTMDLRNSSISSSSSSAILLSSTNKHRYRDIFECKSLSTLPSMLSTTSKKKSNTKDNNNTSYLSPIKRPYSLSGLGAKESLSASTTNMGTLTREQSAITDNIVSNIRLSASIGSFVSDKMFRETVSEASISSQIPIAMSSNQKPVFELYIQHEGSEVYMNYSSLKQQLKELKAEIRASIRQLNNSKLKIDQLTESVESTKYQHSYGIDGEKDRQETSQTDKTEETQQQSITKNNNADLIDSNISSTNKIDDETLKYADELQYQKILYKSTLTDYLTNRKHTLPNMEELLKETKSQLVSGFLTWSVSSHGLTTSSQYLLSSEYDDNDGNEDDVEPETLQNQDQDSEISSIRKNTRQEKQLFPYIQQKNQGSRQSTKNRIIEQCPESIPFYAAYNEQVALMAKNGKNIKLMQKYKRLNE